MLLLSKLLGSNCHRLSLSFVLFLTFSLGYALSFFLSFSLSRSMMKPKKKKRREKAARRPSSGFDNAGGDSALLLVTNAVYTIFEKVHFRDWETLSPGSWISIVQQITDVAEHWEGGRPLSASQISLFPLFNQSLLWGNLEGDLELSVADTTGLPMVRAFMALEPRADPNLGILFVHEPYACALISYYDETEDTIKWLLYWCRVSPSWHSILEIRDIEHGFRNVRNFFSRLVTDEIKVYFVRKSTDFDNFDERFAETVDLLRTGSRASTSYSGTPHSFLDNFEALSSSLDEVASHLNESPYPFNVTPRAAGRSTLLPSHRHVPSPRRAPRNPCAICLEPQDDMIVVNGCQHDLCRDCMQGYVVSKLGTEDTAPEYPILCPCCVADRREEEPSEIPDAVIKDLNLSREQRARLERLRIDQVAINVECLLCQRPVPVDLQDYRATKVLACPTGCGYTWCKDCQDSAVFTEEHTCNVEIDAATRRAIRREGLKNCPGCGVLVERTEGCNHMTCRMPGCNTHFCYRCGQLVTQSTSQPEIRRHLDAHFNDHICPLFGGIEAVSPSVNSEGRSLPGSPAGSPWMNLRQFEIPRHDRQFEVPRYGRQLEIPRHGRHSPPFNAHHHRAPYPREPSPIIPPRRQSEPHPARCCHTPMPQDRPPSDPPPHQMREEYPYIAPRRSREEIPPRRDREEYVAPLPRRREESPYIVREDSPYIPRCPLSSVTESASDAYDTDSESYVSEDSSRYTDSTVSDDYDNGDREYYRGPRNPYYHGPGQGSQARRDPGQSSFPMWFWPMPMINPYAPRLDGRFNHMSHMPMPMHYIPRY
ncbi:hypothetical protein M422DRAFT_776039 [Sphaerobolus stellatus SS14]|nr:hypothetical protein M422DRAFT_776039 [Sphaerobolus stellatus SS14]